MNENTIIPVESGVLLVARPDTLDPNFDRSVVFLLSHYSDSGSMGLIINRPSAGVIVDEDSPLVPWLALTAEPSVPFVGGPVEPTGFICMAPDESAGNGVSSVDIQNADPLITARPFRLFHGYAGWDAGQLDAEIRGGGWFVVPSEPDDMFTSKPETLWNEVLARQPGELGKLGRFYVDPTLN